MSMYCLRVEGRSRSHSTDFFTRAQSIWCRSCAESRIISSLIVITTTDLTAPNRLPRTASISIPASRNQRSAVCTVTPATTPISRAEANSTRRARARTRFLRPWRAADMVSNSNRHCSYFELIVSDVNSIVTYAHFAISNVINVLQNCLDKEHEKMAFASRAASCLPLNRNNIDALRCRDRASPPHHQTLATAPQERPQSPVHQRSGNRRKPRPLPLARSGGRQTQSRVPFKSRSQPSAYLFANVR